MGAAKIKKNVDGLSMRYEEGRAEKAAQLHLVDGSHESREPAAVVGHDADGIAIYETMADRFTDRRGGDHWKTRGEGGVWHRVHTKPRKSLFTPFKVAKGPTSSETLNVVRFTKGVTQSGHKFEFHDNWQKSQNSHRHHGSVTPRLWSRAAPASWEYNMINIKPEDASSRVPSIAGAMCCRSERCHD